MEQVNTTSNQHQKSPVVLTRFSWLMGSAFVIATQSLAFVTPDNVSDLPLKTVTNRPETYLSDVTPYSSSGTAIEVEQDALSNAVRYISSPKLFGVHVTQRSKSAFESAALNAIKSNKSMFGVDITDVRVNPKATMVSGDDASVMLHVYRQDLRIQDANIIFSFKKGSLFLVKNESYSEAVEAASIDHIDSGEIARDAVGSFGFVGQGQKWRVKPVGSGYQLVKVDEFLVAGQNEPFVVQVDKSDGSVFELRSKRFHLRGAAKATAYPRYYKDQPQATALSFASINNATSLSNDRGEFQLQNGSMVPSLKGLSGQYVDVVNESGDPLEVIGENANNFWSIHLKPQVNEEVPWDNNDMAQSMVYIGTNKMVTLAKKYIYPEWFNEALKAHVNHDEHCNAYWDGTTINFFSAGDYRNKTCANTGLIADVVFHEWGHGLDDNTGGIDDSGLSEGYGDALSNLMTDDSIIGINFLPKDQKPVRDASVLKVYPADVSFDPHITGLIVAGSFWDLSNLLKARLGDEQAKHLMSIYLFKGIYKYAKLTDVYKAVLALDDDNGNVNDGTPNFCDINKSFSRHGLAKLSTDCP
jgi:hypothetical protein